MKRSAAYVCVAIATVGAFSQAMTACNTIGDIQPTDASVSDVQRPDAAPPACGTDPPPVMMKLNTQGDPVPANWSCYADGGAADAQVFFPLGLDAGDDALDADLDAADADDGTVADGGPDAADGGDAGTNCRFKLTDFVLQKPVPGAGIKLFFHNDPFATPDFTGTTDNNGELLFPAPGTTLMGYGIVPTAEIKALVWLDNQSCTAGQRYDGQSITKVSYDLLLNGFTNNGQLPIDPKKMTVVAGVRDCDYKEVSGGIIEIFDDTTGLPLVSGKQGAGYDDFRAAYFGSMGTPDNQCTHTVAQQSLYAAINVPTSRSMTVRASGRMVAGGEIVVLGERKLPLIEDMIVIVRPYKMYKQ